MSKDFWVVAIEFLFAVLCGLAAALGPSSLQHQLYVLVGPSMVWEFIDAFYRLFLSDIRSRPGSFLSWSFVTCVSLLVVIYAVAVDGWVVLSFAILTGRHILARRAGHLKSAFANTVEYVFAVFPAGFVAYVTTYSFELEFATGLLIFAGLYFGARTIFMTIWNPHRWLAVEWRGE